MTKKHQDFGDAQIRQFAAVEEVIQLQPDGTIKVIQPAALAPEIGDIHFRAPYMDVAHTYVGGKKVPLSTRCFYERKGIIHDGFG